MIAGPEKILNEEEKKIYWLSGQKVSNIHSKHTVDLFLISYQLFVATFNPLAGTLPECWCGDTDGSDNVTERLILNPAGALTVSEALD